MGDNGNHSAVLLVHSILQKMASYLLFWTFDPTIMWLMYLSPCLMRIKPTLGVALGMEKHFQTRPQKNNICALESDVGPFWRHLFSRRSSPLPTKNWVLKKAKQWCLGYQTFHLLACPSPCRQPLFRCSGVAGGRPVGGPHVLDWVGRVSLTEGVGELQRLALQQ